MERLIQRLADSTQTLATLKELVGIQNRSKAEQSFLLVQEGVDVASPKSMIRQCQQVAILTVVTLERPCP